MKRLKVRHLTLIASTVLTTAYASVVFSPSAEASPKGMFSIFSDCPLSTPEVLLCQYGLTTSGEFSIGTTRVPITRTITLQGAALPIGEALEFSLVPAADGNSMSKTELDVPGGLSDFFSCEAIKGGGEGEVLQRNACRAALANPATTRVTATTEIAASARNIPEFNLLNLATATGSAITLPIKIHLNNQLLGSSCYIGSDADPIMLKLTTGTTAPSPPNRPISGSVGVVEFMVEEGQELLRLSQNSLVDNAFSVPGVQGCGGVFSSVINPIVNRKLKLPSPAGENTAVLNGTLNTAPVKGVQASESFPLG